MNTVWQLLLSKLEACSLRERLLFVLTLMTVMGFVSVQGLIKPLSQLKANTQQALIIEQEQVQKLQQQFAQLTSGEARDKNKALAVRKQQLQQELTTLDQQLGMVAVDLIPAAKMPVLLKDILHYSTKVQLKSLANIPVLDLSTQAEISPSGEEDTTKLQAKYSSRLYRHGVKLELEGGFMDLVSYLQLLENLPWKFIWADLNYEVLVYPKAKITIEVYTLSDEEGWVGV